MNIMLEQIRAGNVLRFEYPQFDHISQEFTHHEIRELAVEKVWVGRKGQPLVNGLRLLNGQTEYRTYHVELMQNAQVIA